ncbi:MAG: 3-phosphoshikimate 1-carboxyvinyltransferase [Actinobacteria bacterium]|nr:3-phosphoshikimate 1-carboxyvinyltransferase [Actinomycetota bacterium]
MWRAPCATSPVHGVVQVPGSKSITNRALILACLSDGPSFIGNPLHARDTAAMTNGLLALGYGVHARGAHWDISPTLHPHVDEVTIDCDQAGTVMRFLPPVAGLTRGDVTFDAHASARTRPIRPMLDALCTLGVHISDDTTFPFTLRGTGNLRGGRVTIDASASSQFVSALLLVAARADESIIIEHRSASGADVPSLPHIAMTCAMLAAHGVHVESRNIDGTRSWQVPPGPMTAHDWQIEPDLSNALPFIGAAAVTGGEVHIAGLGSSTLQPYESVTNVLTQLGCSISVVNQDFAVKGPGQLSGIDVDLSDIAETAVTFAAICAHASAPSRLRGIEHIRGHETDRIAAIIEVLTTVGCGADYADGVLTIEPKPLKPAVLPSFGDHRMATAAAILGLGVDGVTVEDITTTSKTLPEFSQLWLELVNKASA